MTTGTYKTINAAARAYGAEHGVTANQGGWLYRNGVRFIQGWNKYGRQLINLGVILEVDADGNEPDDWRKVTQYRVIEQCGTIRCRSEATEEIRYHYRGEADPETDRVCTPCAQGYARRPVCVGLVRIPLKHGVPVLQIYVRGWTALNSRGTWVTMRPASPEEIGLSSTIEHGQFWLRSDGGIYYHPFAKSNADQAARVRMS